MAGRLNRLENETRVLRHQLLEKDKDMQRLRRQNDLLEQTVNGSGGGGEEKDGSEEAPSAFNSNPNVGSQYIPLPAPASKPVLPQPARSSPAPARSHATET